jgi:membrane protease YdiL (CAAX protease family)
MTPVIDAAVKRPWLPYVAPMAAYMAFLFAQSDKNLAWLYPVKVTVVAGLLWFYRKQYDELRPGFSVLAVAVGLVAIAVWIFGDAFYPKLDWLMLKLNNLLSRLLGDKPGPDVPTTTVFDPFSLGAPVKAWSFVGFRIFGAVVVVPLMEELFWRAFVIRWLVKEDFKAVPVGTFTWFSFAATVFMFGVEHNEWAAGLVCGALYNWLYYRSKSVFACVVAHATSNAALAAWVLWRGDWKFW